MKNEKGISRYASDLRKKAEIELGSKKPKSELPGNADALALLHELQVHQIELEMQNAELREQRNKAEEATQKYENLYNEIYDFTPAGIYSLSSDGIISELNLTGAILLGSSRSDLINKNFKGFLSPGSVHRFEEFLINLFTQKTKSTFDAKIDIKNHDPLYVHIEGTLTIDETRCLMVATDITSYHKVEDQLLESKNKLNLALDIANLGVWEWNLKTEVLELDDRMENILDIKSHCFEGTYDAFERFIVDEDTTHVRQAINSLIRDNSPFNVVFRIKQKNGSVKYLISTAILSRDNEMTPTNIIGACYDITQMKKGVEKTLLKLNDELLRSNKELQQFAYIASHDLQEPLRMVTSFTQLLATQYHDKLDSKANEYIQFAVDGSKRMFDLINGLLAFSRVKTKASEFGLVDMNRVLRKVLQIFEIRTTEKKVNVIVHDLPEILADENQMVQIMQNLVDNAIKFSPPGTTVTISSYPDEEYFVFSVKDQGIGIDEVYFEKIFMIFQRLVNRDEYPGTGIGLSICKRIAEHHGGTIWVESKPEKGSKFFFTIPIQRTTTFLE